MHSFSQNWEVRQVHDPVAAAANTDANSDRIDMLDYESATFIVPIDDSVSGGVATLKVETNSADSDSGMTAVTGATATATSAANDDLNGKLLIVEVRHPSSRYIQGVITSATQNIAFGDMVVVLRKRRVPIVDDASVADAAYVAG